MNLRNGSGWSLIDTSQLAREPGAYDVGALLGVTTGSVWLVILRAAERWVLTTTCSGKSPRSYAARVMFRSSSLTVRHTR